MDRASVRQLPGKPAAGTGAACLPKGPTSSHVPGFAAGASERMLPFCRRLATCPQQAATRCAPGHDVGTGQHALLARHGRPCGRALKTSTAGMAAADSVVDGSPRHQPAPARPVLQFTPESDWKLWFVG